MLFLILAHPQIKHEDSLKETQVLRVGQKVGLNTEISGIPAPEVSWSVDGQPLLSNGNIFIEGTISTSNVVVAQAERRHAGVYTLSLENLVGKATAEFTVVVKGNIN